MNLLARLHKVRYPGKGLPAKQRFVSLFLDGETTLPAKSDSQPVNQVFIMPASLIAAHQARAALKPASQTTVGSLTGSSHPKKFHLSQQQPTSMTTVPTGLKRSSLAKALQHLPTIIAPKFRKETVKSVIQIIS